MRKMLALIASLLLLTLPALALGQTRALLVACHDFLSMPGLGNSVSGNLHIIGSALVGAGLNVGSLSIEMCIRDSLSASRCASTQAWRSASTTTLRKNSLRGRKAAIFLCGPHSCPANG